MNTNEKYLYYGQNERVEELNERILERFQPDSPLEPNLAPRSVPTKYSHFPIVNLRCPSHVKMQSLPNFSVHTQFAPLTKGPVSGFMANIDKETVLRNQNFALQRDIAQSTFIPSSNSDLYKTYIVSRPSQQPYPKLFEEYSFDQRPHPNITRFPEVGNDLFFNATRQQLRGSGN
jgi:hypothetical protein